MKEQILMHLNSTNLDLLAYPFGCACTVTLSLTSLVARDVRLCLIHEDIYRNKWVF